MRDERDLAILVAWRVSSNCWHAPFRFIVLTPRDIQDQAVSSLILTRSDPLSQISTIHVYRIYVMSKLNEGLNVYSGHTYELQVLHNLVKRVL